MHARRLSVLLAAALALMLAAGPAFAQTAGPAQDGRGSAYGARLNTAVGEVLGPEPSVEAAFPPGESDEDVLLEVPADPVLNSGTLSVESQAEQQPSIEAKLQQDIAGQSGAAPPEAWNARGYAIAEQLAAIEGTLTADVIEGEAVASCVDGQPVYATGANLVNTSLGGTGLLEGAVGGEDPTGGLLEGVELTADQPNNEVLNQAGVKVVTWETNWDGADGTTDGSDTVWVNGLHVTIDLELLDAEVLPEELQNLVDQLLGQTDGGGGTPETPEDPTGEDPTGEDPTGGLLDGGGGTDQLDGGGTDQLDGGGGTDQLQQGAESQDEDVESLESETQNQTRSLDPEGVEEPDAGTDGTVDTDADSEVPAAESLGASSETPAAQTLETDAEGADGVQVQQEGSTVDLIVSHAEAEIAACGPGGEPEPPPEPGPAPAPAPTPDQQPLPRTGGGAATLPALAFLGLGTAGFAALRRFR